jgi:hypothetical protein
VVFLSWLGTYHKYGTYLAITHTNIDVEVKTDSTVLQCTSKQIDSFRQVLGLGWVYLATEDIIPLASLTES